MPKGIGWLPEELEAMRKMRDEQKASLTEIGQAFGGISRSRVKQLIGHGSNPDARARRVAARNSRAIVELSGQGLTPKQIADKTGLHVGTVYKHRIKAGIRRQPRFPPERCIWCARKWAEEYGYTPAATDWNPTAAIAYGQKERAERFFDFRKRHGCPRLTEIIRKFGSWSSFIAEAGLLPAPVGGAARDYWKRGRAA